jgi:hypothetical protein
MQTSIAYELVGPDGIRAVVGNSDAAMADPDFCGNLLADNGVSISREIREIFENLADREGARHGLFGRGRATIVFNGAFPGSWTMNQCNAAESKIRRAMRAYRFDGKLTFTPDGQGIRSYWFRANQDLQVTGRRPKTFQFQLVSPRPNGLNPVENLVTLSVDATRTLWWRLNEATGTTANDASGNGRTGTYAGTYTLAQTGLEPGSTDKAVLFNTGYATSTYSPFVAGSTITVEGRAKRTDSATQHQLFGGNAAGTTSPSLQMDSGANTITFWNGRSAVTWNPGASVAPGTSFHWAVVYNDTSKQASLYINGALVSTQGLANSYGTPTGQFVLGAYSSGFTYPFKGVLDEVAVYSGALSAAKIASHAASGILAADSLAALTNAGDYPTYPRFRINGPTPPVVIQNDAAGRKLTFSYADAITGLMLGAAEYLDVFCDPVGAVGIYLGAAQVNKFGWLDRANSDWWRLDPGLSNVRFYTAAGGLPYSGSALTVGWRDSWE